MWRCQLKLRGIEHFRQREVFPSCLSAPHFETASERPWLEPLILIAIPSFPRTCRSSKASKPLILIKMVKIEPFEVEQWMDRLETTPGVLNIAETCAASVSLDDLVHMCEDGSAPGPFCLSTKLTYGPIRGSQKLRQRVASLFDRASDGEHLPAENVVITQGAIAANFLLFYTLVGPGDHVICVYPTYQQLYAVPQSLGAEVSLWRLKEESAYVPDVAELEGSVRANTKVGHPFSSGGPR